MIDKNLRIEISQKNGSILKSNNAGGLKVGVDKKRQIVIISAEDIDKSVYKEPSVPIEQNKKILLGIPLLVLAYSLILCLCPSIYQIEKFILSFIFISFAGCIYSHFYKNYGLMFPILILFILVAAFVCGFISFETLIDVFEQN